jgi:predicted CopG family antitoxin
MPTKSITITEDAYEHLRRHKRPGESFSDVIRRTFGGGSARSLIGLLTADEADAMREGLEARRERRAARRERRSRGRS